MTAKLVSLFTIVLLPFLADSVRAADESSFMAIVESSASAGERAEACRRLLDVGSARCIPVLAAALADEGVGHAALHTLERLPQPEAGAALREALTSLSGPLKASVADALGWRRDPLAVPSLALLLRDRDEALAATSALALGEIGNVTAEVALTNAMSQVPVGVRPAVMEACLFCAEARLQAGQAPAAIALYDRILAAEPPQAVKAAANRGLLVADEPRRAERLVRWITGTDPLDRRVALQFLPELCDGAPLLPLLPHWKSLPSTARIALLENHRLLGAEAPGLAITAAQGDDAAERLTALRVMGGMNSPNLVPVLAKAAVTGPQAEQLLAQNALAALSGPGIEEAILSHLEQARGTEQVLLLRTLGQRRNERSATVLLRHARAEDPSTRREAREALLLLASPTTLQPVIELALATGKDDAERAALARIIGAICQNPIAASTGDAGFIAAIDSLASQLMHPEHATAAAELQLAIAESLLEQRPRLAARAAKSIADRSTRPESVGRARVVLRSAAEFRKIKLTDRFQCEGASFGDFNRDGHMDVVAGWQWFAGPDFKQAHDYTAPPAQPYDAEKSYSDYFLTYVYDFNSDGWPDILVYSWPGKDASWYQNPGEAGGYWKKHVLLAEADNESPQFDDITGDGKPELICHTGGRFGFAEIDWDNPSSPALFRAISPADPKNIFRYTHGYGFGDINGDGRTDIIEKNGWWEQPEDYRAGSLWTFHKAPFAPEGARGGAQMLVFDVNGDGRNDVITSLDSHGYGLAWFEQRKDGSFLQHTLVNTQPGDNPHGVKFTQIHALALADVNGDGLMDFITGKRYWAHGPGKDAEPDAPAVLYWFELKRGPDGAAEFIPRLVDDDSGVGTQVTAGDLNGDGLTDIISANKKGVSVFIQQP